MILVLKMTKKYHITWYWCQNIRDNMVKKKGSKNSIQSNQSNRTRLAHHRTALCYFYFSQTEVDPFLTRCKAFANRRQRHLINNHWKAQIREEDVSNFTKSLHFWLFEQWIVWHLPSAVQTSKPEHSLWILGNRQNHFHHHHHAAVRQTLPHYHHHRHHHKPPSSSPTTSTLILLIAVIISLGQPGGPLENKTWM